MSVFPRLAILVCTFIGASTIVLAEPLIRVMPPFMLLGVRFFLAALLLALVCLKRVFPISRASVKAGLITGAGFGIGCTMIYLALPHVRPGKLTFLISLEVLIVPLISLLFLRKPVSRPEKLALIPALAGLWLITGNSHVGFSWWEGVVLLSALAYAVYTLSLSHVPTEARLFSRTFICFLVIGSTALLVSLIIEDRHGIEWSQYHLLGILYLVIIGSLTRFLLQSWAQQYVSASFAALTFTAEPVFGIAMSYYFIA
jgi:drug/metabolite transporter (DMT)-like permease